ncbi:beta strand repeat-containing protein [Qipengyuania soli]|uniref:beta strand repeat-containing protein n=1 Tax=Qipengyuania soli TaxID=2782568 RepID=UPI001FE8DE41|nr:VCBS domain-containing protein [Qipengyuania soli]
MADNDTQVVDEAALSFGSNPSLTTETVTGQLAVAGTGVTYALNSGSNTYGTLTLNPDGSYSYTLTAPYDTSPDADNGTNTELGAESYSYTATDANGNTVTGTITINIVDDVPTAVADTNSVTEGGDVSGNVLTDAADEFGADGAEAAGGVVGVRAAGGDTTSDATGNVGATINGLYGTLTLNADGSYTYVSTANAVTGDVQDVFVYTIEDGDGDLSTTTLTIDVDNVTLVADNDIVTVNEAAMDTTQTGSDVAAGSITGSNPGLTTETATGQLVIAGASGFSIAGGVSAGGFTTVTTAYGTLVLNESTGAYTYTLTSPYSTNPASNNGVTTETGVENFTYTATDANGNTVTGSIRVDVIDDVPVALVPDAVEVINGPSAPTGPISLDFDDNVANNYGADGAGTIRFPGSLEGADSGLTSSFQPITYHLVNGQTLQGIADGQVIFTVTLNPANGTYSVDMDGTIDSIENVQFNPLVAQFVGGNGSWTGFVPFGDSVTTPVDNDSQDLLLTPEVNGVNGGTINSTANTGGVSGGASVGSGETFRVDFVTDLRGNPADSVQNDYAGAANRDHVFDGHYTVNGAFALFKSTGGSTIRVGAYDDPDGNTVVGDGQLDHITGVVIVWRGTEYSGPNGETIITTSGNYTINGHVFTVTFNANGTVDVAGVEGDNGSSQVGTQIAVFTDDGFNSVEYSYLSGGTFQVGGFGASTLTTDPVSWDIPVEVVDGDGDVSSTGDISITAVTPSTTTTLAEPFSASAKSAPVSEPLLASSTDPLTSNNNFQSELRSMGMMSLAASASGFAMNHQVSDFGGFELRAMVSEMGFESPAFHASSLVALPDVNLGFEMGASHFAASTFSIPVAMAPMSGFDSFEASPMSGLIDMAQGHVSGFANNGFAMAEPAIDSGFASALPMSDAMGGMEALLMLAAAPAAQEAVALAGDPAAALADLGAQSALDAAIDYFATGEPFGTAGLGGEAGNNAMLAGMLDAQIDSFHAVGMGSDLVQDAALVLETASHA